MFHIKVRSHPFEVAIQQAGVWVAVVALEERFLWVNRKVYDITGYGREELSTLTFGEIIHPEGSDSRYFRRKTDRMP